MHNQYINFKRKRELGEIITDTFKFFRRNSKPIFRNLFKIAGIPLVLFIAATAYNAQSTAGTSALFDFANPYAIFEDGDFLLSSIIFYLFLFIFLTFLQATILSIIKSYITNEGVIVDEEVSNTVKVKLGEMLLVGLVKSVLAAIGYMLCVIPGIYVSIPFYFIFPLIIFDNKKIGDVFSSCFDLVKDNWWITFATFFVLHLLWNFISLIFALPSMIYVWVKMFTSMQEGSLSNPEAFYDIGIVIFTVIASVLKYISYIFMPIGVAFIYYNLNEHKNQTGTMELIDRIGE